MSPPLAALVAFACTASAEARLPPPGLYSGALKHRHALVQLEVRADGTARLRQVVTVHLPPAEIESSEVKLAPGPQGQVCLEPEPRTVERCLRPDGDGRLVARLKSEKGEVTLVRRPASK